MITSSFGEIHKGHVILTVSNGEEEVDRIEVVPGRGATVQAAEFIVKHNLFDGFTASSSFDHSDEYGVDRRVLANFLKRVWSDVETLKPDKPSANLFAAALRIAVGAHGNQVDKAGRHILEHLLRVADRPQGDRAWDIQPDLFRAVAVLHDIIEDADLSREALAAWLTSNGVNNESAEVISLAVEIVSRRDDETYADYIARIAGHRHAKRHSPYALAREVKRADLRDHLAIRDGYKLPASLRKRYERALRNLEPK